MNDIRQLTDICRIGMMKESGDEWIWYSKEFVLTDASKYATVKLTSDGVCAVYVNGEFVEAHTGRLPNRIFYVEITSKLKKGQNEIRLLLGSHFYQNTGIKVQQRRGSWFADVAAEVEIETSEGMVHIPTDGSWCCQCDLGEMETTVLSEISVAEYKRFWEHAAIYHEVPEKICVPKEIEEVAGKEYVNYIKTKDPQYAYPEIIREDENGILYDFGRLVVGYTVFEYEAEKDSRVKFYYDYSESTKDFETDSEYAGIVTRLLIRYPIKKGCHTAQLIHRRACRYMLIRPDDAGVTIKNCKILISMTPATKKGWFRCNESLLNEIWEVGKYTLWVNKHQEYESCPRHEMKFFSGDGIIAALIDYYAFGYEGLADASLACTEPAVCLGLRHDRHSRNDELWDYPAWRIIMAYNHYQYSGDKAFLQHYYPELVDTLMWMVDKVGKDDLIYQYPVWFDGFFAGSGSVEYTCSYDRLGEKTYLNALLYQSLKCMSELGEIMEDSMSNAWSELAKKMYVAINEKLWNEEMGAYIDLQYPDNYPQDGNALAVLFGLADKRKTKQIFKSLEDNNWSLYGSTIASTEMMHTRKGNQTISPLMNGYEAEARFLSRDHEGALELIRRCWGTMVKKGAGTFWEFAPNDGEKRWPIPSHAWSAGATYLLSAYVLGVRPAMPGYEKLLFHPSDKLESFEGVVPTKKGYVAVNCRTKSDGQKVYTIALPEFVDMITKIPEGAEVKVIRYRK